MELAIKRWKRGDWVELTLDGQPYHAGHEVPDFVWEELLERAGVQVTVLPEAVEATCSPDCPCRN